MLLSPVAYQRNVTGHDRTRAASHKVEGTGVTEISAIQNTFAAPGKRTVAHNFIRSI